MGMSSKLWLLMPCLALATAGFLTFSPRDVQTAAAAVPCTKVAAEAADSMTDAAPDACVYAVGVVTEPACAERVVAIAVTEASARVAAITATRADQDADVQPSLEWPVDFIVLTADAAGAVFHATLGFIGDAYDFAERKAELLWI